MEMMNVSNDVVNINPFSVENSPSNNKTFWIFLWDMLFCFIWFDVFQVDASEWSGCINPHVLFLDAQEGLRTRNDRVRGVAVSF